MIHEGFVLGMQKTSKTLAVATFSLAALEIDVLAFDLAGLVKTHQIECRGQLQSAPVLLTGGREAPVGLSL